MENTPGPHSTQKTILVVDDDPAVLNFVGTLLLQGNYNVLTAGSGEEALERSKDCTGDIDLLLSDFQMPGMSGIDLATQLCVTRPETKVLLMSGFAGGMLVLNEGWHFLAKPFIPSQLRALIVGLVSPDRDGKFKAPDP